MANWRDQILKEFTPQVARLTLVADPDGLLLEETLLEAIRERGFELIPFEDHVAFRFAYESKFRSHWDRGEITDLVVVLRAERHDLSTLPYDLLQAGRQLCFDLGELFSSLSYPVIASLDRSDLDALYRAQKQHKPDRLGDNATKDFVLLHVFEIAPALIKQPSDLLRVLLRRHYRGQRVPRPLDDRLVQVLQQSGSFDSWPIETIVPDREAFFSFLQERWPLFLDRLAGDAKASLREEGEPYGLKIKGPADLPFDHDDVRVYIDNLFVEGMLRPVSHKSSSTLSGEWVTAGIRTDPAADTLRRLEGLIETVSNTIPGPDARHHDWSVFAYRWSELSVLWSETPFLGIIGHGPTDYRSSYRSRSILPYLDRAPVRGPSQPTIRSADNGTSSAALPQPPEFRCNTTQGRSHCCRRPRPRSVDRASGCSDDATIAPSLSRKWSICMGADAYFCFPAGDFAGKPPLYFPSSIQTTNKEASLWTQFWADHGLTTHEVGYVKGLGDGPLGGVRELLSRPKIRALGLVVDKVDKIMHGMELGAAGMHNQVRQWANEQFMAELLDTLLESDFAVFLTSDHGNIEADGCGRPSEGAIADLRGERARVYPDPILRSRVKERFPDAIEWPALGLPEDYLALLAAGRSAFVREGERIVGHGGISLEEIVVPLIQIERLAE